MADMMREEEFVPKVAALAWVDQSDVKEVTVDDIAMAYDGIIDEETIEEVLYDEEEGSRYYLAGGQYYICDPSYPAPLPVFQEFGSPTTGSESLGHHNVDRSVQSLFEKSSVQMPLGHVEDED